MIYSYKNIQTEHSDELTAWVTFVEAIENAINEGFLDEPSVWVVIREMRKEKLQESDWSLISDAPLSAGERLEWTNYRQALWDISQSTRPADVVWPNQPAANPRDSQALLS